MNENSATHSIAVGWHERVWNGKVKSMNYALRAICYTGFMTKIGCRNLIYLLANRSRMKEREVGQEVVPFQVLIDIFVTVNFSHAVANFYERMSNLNILSIFRSLPRILFQLNRTILKLFAIKIVFINTVFDIKSSLRMQLDTMMLHTTQYLTACVGNKISLDAKMASIFIISWLFLI